MTVKESRYTLWLLEKYRCVLFCALVAAVRERELTRRPRPPPPLLASRLLPLADRVTTRSPSRCRQRRPRRSEAGVTACRAGSGCGSWSEDGAGIVHWPPLLPPLSRSVRLSRSPGQRPASGSIARSLGQRGRTGCGDRARGGACERTRRTGLSSSPARFVSASSLLRSSPSSATTLPYSLELLLRFSRRAHSTIEPVPHFLFAHEPSSTNDSARWTRCAA